MADFLTAAPVHAPVLAAIHAASFPAAERWSADAFAAQLRQPGVSGLLDPAGGMILLRLAADEAEVLTLAVLPELRRRGLGRRLLDQGCALAAERGAGAMFLEVAASNTAARALYGAEGFAPVGRRRRYYADGDDALVLRRALTAARRASPPPPPA